MSENTGDSRQQPTWPSATGDNAVPQWAAPGGGSPQPFASPSGQPPELPSLAPTGAPLPPPPPGYRPPAGSMPPANYRLNHYKPGIIPLRPLNFGELLDGSIKAIRHNPKVMVGLNALVVLVAMVVLFAMSFGFYATLFSFDPATDAETFDDFPWGDIVLLYVGAFASSLVLTLVTAIASISVARSSLGQVVSVGEAFSAALRRFPTVIVITLLLSAGFIIAFAVVVVVIILAAAANVVLGIVLGVLLALGAFAAMVWVAIKLAIAIPAAVLEKIGPVAAIMRSWRLTAGRFWMIFSVLLVASIITSIIQQVISTPVTFVLPLFAPNDPESIMVPFIILLGVLTFIGVLISTVFLAGVTAVIYTDQRMRREGFDLVLARAAQGQ